jgi:hypothetical protein
MSAPLRSAWFFEDIFRGVCCSPFYPLQCFNETKVRSTFNIIPNKTCVVKALLYRIDALLSLDQWKMSANERVRAFGMDDFLHGMMVSKVVVCWIRYDTMRMKKKQTSWKRNYFLLFSTSFSPRSHRALFCSF